MKKIKVWWSDNRDVIIYIAVIMLIAFMTFSFGTMIDYFQCIERTKYIGFDSKWSIFGGCIIEVNPDQWIPLDNYYFKQE